MLRRQRDPGAVGTKAHAENSIITIEDADDVILKLAV